jgi:phosphoserine aminotransferase
MARIHNFSAGPAVLPEEVLRTAQADIWDHNGSGIGILECSHRGGSFDAVLKSAKDRIRRLLALSDDQEVLFLHGGARTQFFMVPMNLLRGGRATYFNTGVWSKGAIEDAVRFGTVDVPFDSKPQGYDRVPEPGEWGALPEGTKYVHYTANNTVAGTEYQYRPDAGKAWLFCDMSSNFLSRPVEGSKFDLIYAGAQKNAGPAGVTVVILRKGLLEHCDTNLPAMLRYGVHVESDSTYNTPPVFPIYVVEKVAEWLEKSGGLAAIEKRNIAQAKRLYDQIDSSGFFTGKAKPGSRSRMNITFTAGSEDLDKKFVKEAEAAQLSGLKGHRLIGGLRASLYNAQTDAAVDALVAFMRDFERKNG